jgi:hypothetical protein
MTWADIRQEAMDHIDEQSNPTSGRFSVAWWNRKLNRARHIVYQETGCYLTTFAVSTVANKRTYDLPITSTTLDTFCWGISRVTYDNNVLEATNDYGLDADASGWERGLAGTPQQWAPRYPSFVLSPMPDRSVTYDSAIAGTSSAGQDGLRFTTQPENDGIEVGSDSTADTTQTATIYYVTAGSNAVQTEDIALNGTTYVSSTATDMDHILGVQLDASCAGTINIREASGNASITTITTGVLIAGMYAVPAGTQDAGNVHPTVVAVDNTPACTAQIGLIGTDENGNTVTDCCVNIAGLTKVKFPVALDTVTYLLLGDVPTTNDVFVAMGSAIEIIGGACPADLPTDTGSDTASPTAVPPVFHHLFADGAAALAEINDLYDQPQQGRGGTYAKSFWDGIAKFKEFLNTMNHDEQPMLRINTDLSHAFYNR